MMIFKKALSRRTFLQGSGVILGLPLLDAMTPAFAVVRDNLAVKPVQRLAIVNVPNGYIMEQWTPASEHAAFELTPIMEPLAPFRDRLLVFSGLDQKEGIGREGEFGGEHPRATACYLTCTHPQQTGGTDFRAGVSMDQIIAQEIGKRTPLRSIELTLESNDWLGACENNYSCAYYNTLSWRDPRTPMPTQSNPRVIFEHMFGTSTDPAERRARMGRRRSILDFVSERAAHLRRELGPSDRGKVNQYLDAVREVERRIQIAEEKASSQKVPLLSRPTAVPDTFEEHIQVLFDLITMAFQADVTRIVTFMYGHEMSILSYPQLSAPDTFHAYSHHQGDPDKIEKCVKIETYNTKMFTYLLEKLQATPDGDGSLLDHSMIQFGPSLGDGNLHLHTNIPSAFFPGKLSQIKAGRHVRYPGVPMANLYLTVMDKFGVHLESFGDSTGHLDLS